MKHMYFMGMSTPSGFKTDFYNEHRDFYGYFLKGGPGTGKSTIMKKLADAFSHERISVYYCSSDPRSLDAVVFEDRRIFVADATSPHEADAKLPYATGEIVNLAEAIKREKVVSDMARELNEQNARCHALVRRHLALCRALSTELVSLGRQLADYDAVEDYLIKCKEMFSVAKEGTSHTKKRQMISLTPFGKKALFPKECRVIMLDDKLHYASLYIIERLKDEALRSGLDIEVSQSPFQEIMPYSALYIPCLNIVFCAEQELSLDMENECIVICCDDFYKDESDMAFFLETVTNSLAELEEGACNELSCALCVHDKLEECYIGALCLERLNAIYERLKMSI